MPIDTFKHKGLRKRLCAELRAKGISDESVLAAIEKIPRHFFLESTFDTIAYEDRAVPILCDQTISQPSTVAFQSQLLKVKSGEKVFFDSVSVGEYDTLKTDKRAYADAFAAQYKNTDSVKGRAIVEYYGDKMLVQNPPMPPLSREELDRVYSLPYARDYHPDYEPFGGVPAIIEVKSSITHNRGCFGGCNFCAITMHQGRFVTSRSHESVLAEAE